MERTKRVPWYILALGGCALLAVCLVVAGVAAYLLFRERTDTIAYLVRSDDEDEAGLYLVESDGSDVRLLVPYDPDDEQILGFTWAPDGESIGYIARERQGSEYSSIWVVDVRTGDSTCLVDKLDSIKGYSWSPDSRQIVFAEKWDIRMVNADGSHDTRLAQGIYPQWSPDGEAIAFSWWLSGFGENSVRRIDPDGANEITLLEDAGVFPAPRDWSPDSQWILIDVNLQSAALVLISADGEEQIKLTDQSEVAIYAASFSPDGRWIAYTVFKDLIDDKCTIYLIRSDGTERQRLSNPDGEGCLGISWAPDSSSLIYATRDGAIVSVEIDDGEETSLTEEVEGLSAPAYAP